MAIMTLASAPAYHIQSMFVFSIILPDDWFPQACVQCEYLNIALCCFALCGSGKVNETETSISLF